MRITINFRTRTITVQDKKGRVAPFPKTFDDLEQRAMASANAALVLNRPVVPLGVRIAQLLIKDAEREFNTLVDVTIIT